MILIDIFITIALFITGLFILDDILGPALIFASGAWAMFTLWIWRRK